MNPAGPSTPPHELTSSESGRTESVSSPSDWVEPAPGFRCRPDVWPALEAMGLITFDAVFAFQGGQTMDKANLASWRRRIRFTLPSPDGTPQTAYLKRYDRPPRQAQLRSWIAHGRRRSLAAFDHAPAEALARAGLGVPRTLAYGTEWAGLFERRSFIITAEIPRAESLERRLPRCFDTSTHPGTRHIGSWDHSDRPSASPAAQRRAFIETLAQFIRRFHDTGWRHRDLYLAHVFLDADSRFHLIDLHRAFRPHWRSTRWRLKDLAQLHYSAPGPVFSCTDRIRFYRCYMGIDRLRPVDRRYLRRIRRRAWRMADHDLRHGRPVPFAM